MGSSVGSGDSERDGAPQRGPGEGSSSRGGGATTSARGAKSPEEGAKDSEEGAKSPEGLGEPAGRGCEKRAAARAGGGRGCAAGETDGARRARPLSELPNEPPPSLLDWRWSFSAGPSSSWRAEAGHPGMGVGLGAQLAWRCSSLIACSRSWARLACVASLGEATAATEGGSSPPARRRSPAHLPWYFRTRGGCWVHR